MTESNLFTLKQSLKAHSIVVLRNISEQDCFLAAQDIGLLMPMEENADGNKTGIYTTKIVYDPLQAHTFSHSNTRQPLHTDGSYESNAPNVSILFCREQASIGGETLFMQNKYILEAMHASTLEELKTIPVKHAKGEDSKTRPILVSNDRLSWNWNYFRADRTKEIVTTFKSVLDHLEQCNVADAVLLKAGDAVVFWDEDQLHGRNAFLGQRCLVKYGVKSNLRD